MSSSERRSLPGCVVEPFVFIAHRVGNHAAHRDEMVAARELASARSSAFMHMLLKAVGRPCLAPGLLLSLFPDVGFVTTTQQGPLAAIGVGP